jgi:hypothetical protein
MLRSAALALLLATTPTACGSASPTQPPPVDLGTEATLAPGGAVVVKEKDIQIGFVEVTEDSRCPRDATCVWAGEVKVQLTLRRDGGEPTQREVREGDAAEFHGYKVTLVRVMPYPVSSKTTPAADYRATIKITQ